MNGWCFDDRARKMTTPSSTARPAPDGRAIPPITRVVTVDVARGLLMLYVVIVVHGLFWLNLLPETISSMFLFEMPAIFWVSGYAYFLADQRQRVQNPVAPVPGAAYLRFMASRLWRVLVPYLVYALVCMTVSAGIAMQPNAKPAPSIAEIAASWLNPFSYGREYTVGMLNWHLWFIPTFLVVTALLPLVSKIKWSAPIPPWLGLIAASAVFLALSPLDFDGSNALKQVLFYLMWAWLGYRMARPDSSIPTGALFKVALLAASGLLAVLVMRPDGIPLNMQTHKFPPDHVFVLFSSLWMVTLFGVARSLRTHARRFEALGERFWLRPFVASGYSIYLWHGLGYTLSVWAGTLLGLPVLITWLGAVVGSVALGRIAAPVERWRW